MTINKQKQSASGESPPAPPPPPPPPSYEDSLEGQQHPVPDPPSSAQRAEVPLKVIQKNQSIKENYIVLDKKSGSIEPQVLLSTTNSNIITRLWLQDFTTTPLIRLETTNSRIDVAVYPSPSSQPFRLHAKTTNSGINAALPPSFHGLLTISGRHELTLELKKRAVRVSLDPDEPNKTTYRVGDEGGKSEARLETTNSRILAGLATNAEASDTTASPTTSSTKSPCLLM